MSTGFRARALYGQVALIDAEDPNSYPQWETGEEALVFGPKGVAVAAKIDQLIEITLLQQAAPSVGVLYGSGDILVGDRGLVIGNEVASTTKIVPWPAGRTNVKVFGNAPAGSATEITFVLGSLPD